VLDLLLRIIDGGNPDDSVLAAGYAISLLDGLWLVSSAWTFSTKGPTTRWKRLGRPRPANIGYARSSTQESENRNGDAARRTKTKHQDTHCVRRERKMLIFGGCNSDPATGLLQPVAIEATRGGNETVGAFETDGSLGDSASRQAVIASER